MADASLDDFFAKKDKSKKKNKLKFVAGDLLDTKKDKKKKATKKEDSSQQIEQDSCKKLNKSAEDDEWLEVQEEEKDYSGLRIQNLQIAQEREEDEKEKEAAGSGEDDDESKEGSEGVSGPWAKVQTNVPAPAPIVPEQEPEPIKEETPTNTGKYVPPSKRQAAAAQARSIGPGMGSSRYRKKIAPNLESEEDFPTLGCESVPVDNAWGSKFEKVKSGGKREDERPGATQLELGNKYTALQAGTE